MSKQQVVEYSEVEAGLSELEQKFAGIIPDCSTEEGFTNAKADYKEIRGYETKLEKLRKDLKEPILAKGKLLDSEAKRIDGRLKVISAPFKKSVDEETKKRKEEETRRVKVIEERFEGMRNLLNMMHGMEIEDLENTIQDLQADEMRGWMEYETKAYETREMVLGKLNEHLAFLVNKREHDKAMEAERERQRKEAEELEAEREAMRKERKELEALKAQAAAVAEPVEETPEPETTCAGMDSVIQQIEEHIAGEAVELSETIDDVVADKQRLTGVNIMIDTAFSGIEDLLAVCQTETGRDTVHLVLTKLQAISEGINKRIGEM
jgi:hypothetical protein